MTRRDAVDVAADALMDAAVERRLARLRHEIAGMETPAMRGDCLAVMLASDFEAWADQDEETDESGTWKQSAVDACNGVLDAIVALCREAIRALPAPGAPASPWRDMKSAPKDGRPFLILTSYAPNPVHEASWEKEADAFLFADGTICTNAIGWMPMPLPTPPASKDT
jgi:hypothetical protein